MSTDEEKLKILGNQIQTMRESKSCSQAKLAFLAGITREHLSKVERGVAYPSTRLLFSISDILNVKSKDLIVF